MLTHARSIRPAPADIVTRSRRLALCALIAVALLALANPALAVTVTLRDTAEVAHSQVTLGEIAAIGDADGETAASLRAVVVGTAPLAGKSRQLSLESVRVQLRRSDFDPDALQLAGARTVTVTRAASLVAGADIEQAARAALLARLPQGGDTVVTCARAPKDIVVPQGVVTLQAQTIGSARGPSRIMRVVVAVDGQPAARSTLCLRVERYEEVLVAARDIPRGQPLAPEAVGVERRDVMQISGTPLRDLGEIAGRRAKLHLNAGTVLRAQAVESIPVIRRGDPVIVTLRAGAIWITLAGVARSDAAAGEAVRVLNPASKREFTARAVAKGAAAVVLTGLIQAEWR